MLVSDIYADAKDVLGFANQDKVFSRLTDAVEALANKSTWEPLLAYMTIPVQNGLVVTFPDSVEVPLRVNLSNQPAFARDRLYEFVMNGPGTAEERVDWKWEDLGQTQTVDPTTGAVTRSSRRSIRISKTGIAVRALVRLKTTKITSLNDWIPLNSKLAILLMLKAIESYRKGTPQDFQLGQGQEAQALNFLKEEQQSNTAFAEIAKVLDQSPIEGYGLSHVKGAILVADIYDEASAICGGIGKAHVIDAISEAVEVLANKGQWDNMTAYLDIIPNGDLVALPRMCETPIRININKHPALARSRMFEFSINGPGTDATDITTFTWADQGFSAVLTTAHFPTPVTIHGNGSQDQGKHVYVTGIDTNGIEQTVTYTIPADTGPSTPDQVDSNPVTWKTITKVQKDVTIRPVMMKGSGGVLMGYYYPDEQIPQYRLIKLGRPADEVKIMFRKDSAKLSSVLDFIPLTSRTAVLTMLRSIWLLKTPELTADKIAASQQLEAQSLKLLSEEEQSKLGYIQASAKEQQPAYGINWHVRNAITVSDIYDDAADIFGPIGQQRLFDKITEAEEMLANKSQWDGMEGYVDIVTDERGYATLPRKVEVPIAINFWNTPAQMRSKWYEFHLNGMGGRSNICGEYWDDIGEFPLVIEPPKAVRLYGRTEWQPDSSAVVRAYGYDIHGNWIRSIENGVAVDGELVPVHYMPPNDSQQDSPDTITVTNHYFRQVTRITKDETDLALTLFGQYPTGVNTQEIYFLGLYEASETEPMYRRIRVPTWATWIRMRFRKNSLKITRLDDVINLKSKTALVTMMRALKELNSGDINASTALEQKAVQLVSEEQMSRNPGETFDLQFDQRTSWADPLQGRVQ
jgi:hypothetical protein